MDYDLIIIGSGPAGYVAAIRAGQMGLKTAIIEKQDIGGMCLNWGCIPTKALQESAKRYRDIKDAERYGVDGIDTKSLSFNWENALKRATRITRKLSKGVEFLLKKNGVEIITGEATVVSPTSVSVENRIIEANNTLIATGSKPITQKIDTGTVRMIEIWELLKTKNLLQKIAIFGNGPNAVEIAQILTLIDRGVVLISPSEVLLPGTDDYIENFIQKRLGRDGVKTLLNAKITGHFQQGIRVGEDEIPCDLIVNISERKAVTPESKIDIKLKDGFIEVDENLRTNHPSIFAVGDVNGKTMLAHAASAQGLYAVNVINGVKEPIDHTRYPLNIYTYPEIAQIGMTEAEINKKNIEYKISEFPLSANGKALCEGQSEGSVRLLSEKKYGEVLGVQIIARHATDMIAEAAALMTIEGTIYDLASVIHAHPTVSEIFMEAGFEAVDKAIHI